MKNKTRKQLKTIIIADDHPMFANGLASVISEFTPYKVLAIVSNGKDLLHKLNSVQPDMVLLDINMPQVNGISAAQEIKKRFPGIKILVISMYGKEVLRQLNNEVEVDGYISKLSEGKVFTETLIMVMEGKKIIVKQKREVSKSVSVRDNFQEKMNLTDRQKEILRFIKKGLSTKAISEKLNLSIHTINTHRKNICHKLGITSPNALVKWVFENEL